MARRPTRACCATSRTCCACRPPRNRSSRSTARAVSRWSRTPAQRASSRASAPYASPASCVSTIDRHCCASSMLPQRRTTSNSRCWRGGAGGASVPRISSATSRSRSGTAKRMSCSARATASACGRCISRSSTTRCSSPIRSRRSSRTPASTPTRSTSVPSLITSTEVSATMPPRRSMQTYGDCRPRMHCCSGACNRTGRCRYRRNERRNATRRNGSRLR
jgi:hypothetical protein